MPIARIADGLGARPLRMVRDAVTGVEERFLRINTCTCRSFASAGSPVSSYRDNEGYESINYWCLRRILRILKPGPDDVVFDLGSGLGRFLCMAARRRVKKCVGVELSRELCEAARNNARALRGRRAPIEVRCEDAAGSDLSDGTLYYMFNPFGRGTMRDVLGAIAGSLETNPRLLKIVYCNPVHEVLFRECGWLRLYAGFTTALRLKVTFWRSVDGGGP